MARTGWLGALSDDIGSKGVSTQLCLMSFASGILDAVAVAGFSLFFSFQTGNTVFILAGALGTLPGGKLADTCTSLGMFLLATLLAGQIGNLAGRRQRWWLLLSHFSQSIMILLVGLLVATRVNNGGRTRFVSISLLSFASGMQVAMAKSLNCPEVPTVMLTGPYADFLTDPNLFTLARIKSHDRRAAYIFSICSGVVVGAALYRYLNEASAILIAAVVKIVVTLSFCLNPVEDKSHEHEG